MKSKELEELPRFRVMSWQLFPWQKYPIFLLNHFTDAGGNDRMKEMIQDNYNRIRAEVRQIVADELQRIQSDPELQYLLQNK